MIASGRGEHGFESEPPRLITHPHLRTREGENAKPSSPRGKPWRAFSAPAFTWHRGLYPGDPRSRSVFFVHPRTPQRTACASLHAPGPRCRAITHFARHLSTPMPSDPKPTTGVFLATYNRSRAVHPPIRRPLFSKVAMAPPYPVRRVFPCPTARNQKRRNLQISGPRTVARPPAFACRGPSPLFHRFSSRSP